MYADVELELERRQGVLRVPATAVGSERQSRFVFVVRDGALVKAPVVTGIGTGEWMEIRSGLSDDAMVVSNMSPTLSAGAPALAEETGDVLPSPAAG